MYFKRVSKKELIQKDAKALADKSLKIAACLICGNTKEANHLVRTLAFYKAKDNNGDEIYELLEAHIKDLKTSYSKDTIEGLQESIVTKTAKAMAEMVGKTKEAAKEIEILGKGKEAIGELVKKAKKAAEEVNRDRKFNITL